MEHKLILGGNEFLPFARSCVTKLKKLGLAHASQAFEVGGVSIKVRIEPGHEYIRIEGDDGYVESGVLDLHEIQLGLRAAYRPATIKFTPFVLARVAKPVSLPNAGSRKVKDDDDSWSASGCAGKIKVIDTTVGSDTKIHFDSNPAEFCDPDRMKKFKRIFESIPSSTYTGKLKLFVQALYGSKRTDYRAGGLAESFLEVSTGKFTTPPEGSLSAPQEIFASLTNGYPTHGLLTVPAEEAPETKTNQYVLVGIGIDGVTYRKMNKPGSMPKNVAPEHESLAEVFRLATLVPDDEELIASGPALSELTTGTQRLAHGWHFNKAGTEASIVLMRAKEISGVTFQAFNPATIGGFEFVQYAMTLGWRYETPTVPAGLTYEIREISRGDHIPYLQSSVFYPDLFSNTMVLLTPWGGTPWDCWATLAAPLYCYYDNNDQLVTVTVNNTAPVIIPGEVTPASSMAEITGTQFVTSGSWTTVTLPEAHYVADNGISVGGVAYKGSSKSYYEPTFRSTMVLGSAGTYLASGVGGGSFLVVARNDDESYKSQATCVIPFGDASAVIAGLEKKITGTYNYVNLYWFSNNVPFMNPFSTPPNSARAEWSQYQMLWNIDAESNTAELRKRDYTPSPSSLASNTVMHAATQQVTLAQFSTTWYATDNMPTRPFEGLYNPLGAIAPYYAYPMTVRTSYSGALQHLFCEPVLDPNKPYVSLFGWPDARWSAAVGWV